MFRGPAKNKTLHLTGIIFLAPILWLRPWQAVLFLLLIIGCSRMFFRFTAYGMFGICLLLALTHDSEAAGAAWLTLILGDGMSAVCGRTWGGPTWCWSRRKTLIGSLAFLLSATIALSAFFIFFHHALVQSVIMAFVCAFGAAFVESLPLAVNDNLTVVLAAGMLSWIGKSLGGW